MLQLKNIYKSYIVGEEKQQVLKDIERLRYKVMVLVLLLRLLFCLKIS